MFVVKMEIDSLQVQAMLQAAPAKVNSRLSRALSLSAIETQRELRIAAPAAVTGDLRKSVKYQVNGLTAVVGPTAHYADEVEKGSRPHWTSAKPGTLLYKWAMLKGANPYAVQRSIATKGTRPHPFVKPTFSLMKPKIKQRFDIEMASLAAELNNG